MGLTDWCVCVGSLSAEGERLPCYPRRWSTHRRPMIWATLVLLSSGAHAFPACGIHSASLPRLQLARREPLLAMSGASGQESVRGAAPAGPKAPLARVLSWGMTCAGGNAFRSWALSAHVEPSAARLRPL